jgi:4-hydroxy-2-oxoheptanedioate aldolase
MEMTRNRFKQAVRERRLQVGLWSSLCSNIGAEIVADSGFDWILLDTEHSPNELPGLLSQLQAIGREQATPVIRAAWNDAVLIKRILDIGAPTVLIPYVQNAAEAERAVVAVRYPPRGVRGVSAGSRASRYGRVSNYLKKADDEVCLLVQVETRAALDQLEAIAGVDGVDGVFIGPADLAASCGHLGNAQAVQVQDAIREAAVRLTAAGKAGGILTVNEAEARRYIEWGYTFVAVGIDTNLLAKSADALARSFKPR